MTSVSVVHSGPSPRTVLHSILLIMTTLPRMTLPATMRVDAALVHGIVAVPLAVVHVGQSAVVLRASANGASADTLLILTPETSGLMPGGACLGADDFRRVRDEILSREPAGGDLIIERWDGRSTSAEPVDLVLHKTHVSLASALMYEQALRGLSVADAAPSVMSPDPFRRNAPVLAQQAVTGSVRSETLRAMVGAGPGTTPSGDDIIVGVLAGLRVLGLGEQAASLSRRVAPLIHETTVASRHYLSAAVDGRFGEHVHHIVAALGDGASPAHTLRRAASWGATSGTDLLVGLVATLVTSLNTRSTESAA